MNVGTALLEALNEQRKQKWRDETEDMNFTHSSRKAWSLLRKLGSATTPRNSRTKVNPNLIASKVLNSSKAPLRKNRIKNMKRKVRCQKKQLQENDTFSSPFTMDDLNVAIKQMKTGKAAGLDNMHAEFFKVFDVKVLEWLLHLYNDILRSGNIPKIFKKSKILAVVKPGKPGQDPADYRPISLLCIPFKILERLILNRLDPFLDEKFPIEQAGFRKNRSCEDQVLALTTFIENGFQHQLKTFIVAIDLSSAYDSVWRHGLLHKFIKEFPCRRLANLLSNMLSNRLFCVHLNEETSEWKKLNDGLPQGLVLSLALFNLYTGDLPSTKSQKFIYADDMVLAFQCKSFQEAETILQEDVETMFRYFKLWRLKPNSSKTETSVFHLNNKEADKQIRIIIDETELKFNKNPKYLGVFLDRTLNFKYHLEKLSAKLRSRGNLIQKLAGSTWGADAKTLRISSLSLVYSTAEYCCSVWSRSCHTHLVDTQLHKVMRTITGCISSTPIPWLPVLSHIAPPELRRQFATTKLLRKITMLDNSLLSVILKDVPPQRLKSRSTIQHQIILNFDLLSSWRIAWTQSAVFNCELIDDPANVPGGFNLERKIWVKLNRLRTGHGKCNHCLARWGSGSPECDCGGVDQTMAHIVLNCPLRQFQGSFLELSNAESRRAIDWLLNLDLEL